MHPHPAFRDGDTARHRRMVDAIGFGMIFVETPDGPRVGHVALLATSDTTIQFHLARGNALTCHLAGSTALLVVNGSDAYVSSRWYDDPNQVPTWNYIALELEGEVSQIGRDALLAQLERISALNEARIKEGQPWTMDKLTDDYRDRLMNGITGFELTVQDRRETFKLSQNKPVEERERIAAGLERAGSSTMAKAILGSMQ